MTAGPSQHRAEHVRQPAGAGAPPTQGAGPGEGEGGVRVRLGVTRCHVQNGGSMRSLELAGAQPQTSNKSKFFIKTEKFNKKR